MGTPPSLTDGELVVLGRHPLASNLVLVAEVRRADAPAVTVAYKPVDGERPLWDYPDGTLAAREVAASRIDAWGRFGLVPETVWRDGPLGPGAVQRWIGEVTSLCPTPVAVTPPDAVPDGNLVVLEGEDEGGRPLLLSHPDDPRLRSMAVLDAVINNSDRKGGHILSHDDRLWGIDHGVGLGAEPKLRTVLWGWAGEPIPQEDRDRLTHLVEALGREDVVAELTVLLTRLEVDALGARVEWLLTAGTHPEPSGEWPSIPWPPL
ncbi:SCO1664 family protein [Janibacter limosus]|uniref:SCO1664 family protein n=1 Tax=Janibacter limosus TaxID=53458 RepID=UPI000833D076|nr:SCO1664 family protein [Janibacter limosus]